VGAGIEWAFLPNWSAKVEYNYLGLDDRTFTVPAASPFLASDTFTQSNRSIQMVKVGINYLFNSYYCVPADPACLLNCRCRE
jgi:outer membrane immunogenic protein